MLDNWITFGPNGEAYYTALALPPEKGAPIYVFRSPDKGHTWYGPTKIASTSFDQPRTIAALRDGKVRIYIAAASRTAVLLGSDDGGQSFNTLARIEPDDLPHMAMNPVVLADGSILLPIWTSSRVKDIGSIPPESTLRGLRMAALPSVYLGCC